MKLELDGLFTASPFCRLWAEYSHSLRTIHAEGSKSEVKGILATVPSETFFSKETVVDLQINADFYRHLPGMLTGVGIIGTFSGLVWGLHEFKPDPSQALGSLPLLLQEVGSAFIGSGFAILAAIFVTCKEKSILNTCYRLVEELNREIDGIYALGAGEEYLSRLVYATENNPVVLRELKKSIVDDLSSLMRDVTKQQIEAQQKNSKEMARQMTEAIRDALADPMRELTGVVKGITRSQSEGVADLLDKSLNKVITGLDDTFGGKIETISGSVKMSVEAMDGVREAMAGLAAEIANAGQEAAEGMALRLGDSMTQAEQSQRLLNQQMSLFVEELRDLLLQQQKQSSEIMDVTMRAVLTKLQGALVQMAAERGMQTEQEQKRHDILTANMTRLVEDMGVAAFRTEESTRRLGTVIETLNDTLEGAIGATSAMRRAG
jgi:hypothetical protein